jgi:hypothetical protein
MVAISAANTKAIRLGGSVDFGAPSAIKIISLVLPAGFLVAFLFVLFLRPFEYGSLTLLVVGLLGLLGVPSELTVNTDGIREKYWWKPEQIILWRDVQGLDLNTASGAIQIKSFDGRKINHSRMNRDRDEFARLCMKYTKPRPFKVEK